MFVLPFDSNCNFENFLVTPSNHLAYTTILTVAENPGKKEYNPLLICGGKCVGKTHLLHAIEHLILQRNPNTNINYISAETFVNELILSIRDGKINSLREKYYNFDVLLVDDIQFMLGKICSIEEFSRICKKLVSFEGQVILSYTRSASNKCKESISVCRCGHCELDCFEL